MRTIMIVVALLVLSACATPSPAPAVTDARKAYADCLGVEVQKVAKSSMTVEDAAQAAIAKCSTYRATLGDEVGKANANDDETKTTMESYDTRVHADAVAYINDLRKH